MNKTIHRPTPLLIERTDVIHDVQSKLRMCKGCCVYGMPKVGITTMISQLRDSFLADNREKNQVVYVDLRDFVSLQLKGFGPTSFSQFIVQKINGDEDRGEDTLKNPIHKALDGKMIPDGETLVILDHVDRIGFDSLRWLDDSVLSSIGVALRDLKNTCQILGVQFILCARGDYRFAHDSLIAEYTKLYPDQDQLGITKKIDHYIRTLQFSSSDMEFVHLKLFSSKEIKTLVSHYLAGLEDNNNVGGIDIICTEIKEKVGGHPLLVTVLLENLSKIIYQLKMSRSFLRFDYKSLFVQSYAGSFAKFNNLFDSIWKYSILASDHNTVKKIAKDNNEIFTLPTDSLEDLRFLSDMEGPGMIVDTDDCKKRLFSKSFYQWIKGNLEDDASLAGIAVPNLAGNGHKAQIQILGNTVHVSTPTMTVELTGQAAKFFACLYNNDGDFVTRLELLRTVFGCEEENLAVLNKLYQVKKIVADKLADTGVSVDSTSGKGSRKGYSLAIRNIEVSA